MLPKIVSVYPIGRAGPLLHLDDSGNVYGEDMKPWHQYTDAEGYRRFSFTFNHKKHQFLTHREIFKSFVGPIPDHLVIDHINMQRGDNRLENLRLMTKSGNAMNSGKFSAYFVKRPNGKGRWKAKIRRLGKQCHIGYFDTEEQALAAISACRSARLASELASLAKAGITIQEAGR